MRIFCWLGLHSWGPWIAHTEGPCFFELDVHIFRQCLYCPKQKHEFAQVRN